MSDRGRKASLQSVQYATSDKLTNDIESQVKTIIINYITN